MISTKIAISDNAGHGPFKLEIKGVVVAPRAPVTHEPPKPKETTAAAPSRPDVIEVEKGLEDPPITIERVPGTQRLQIALNTGSRLLVDAKKLRPKEEATTVEFVFKYGLALVSMALLDAATRTPKWKSDEATCREKVQQSAAGVARVIVPLCLTLPSKLPHKISKAA